jgi:ankyrin repeat protein
MRGYLVIVQMLLEKGIDINTRDSQGWTALHLAAERGQHEVVKLLLDRGADVYARI